MKSVDKECSHCYRGYDGGYEYTYIYKTVYQYGRYEHVPVNTQVYNPKLSKCKVCKGRGIIT